MCMCAVWLSFLIPNNVTIIIFLSPIDHVSMIVSEIFLYSTFTVYMNKRPSLIKVCPYVV